MREKRGRCVNCWRIVVALSLLLANLVSCVEGQLVLGQPPVFKSVENTRDRNGVEGETVRLNCDESDFAESYEWRSGGDASGKLISSAHTADVIVSRADDSNVFRCVARNAVGASLSPAVHVRSKYLDDFDGTDELVQYEISSGIGRHFVLRRPKLIASPNLDVTYSWFKDDSYQITPNETHFVTADGDLIVTRVLKSDFGKYKLVASADDLSEIVSKTYTVSDNGMSPPMQASLAIIYWPSDRIVIESRVARDEIFDCVSSFDGKDSVKFSWFLDDQMITGAEVGVSIAMNGRRLVISNPSGFSKGEHKLECKTEAAMGRQIDQKAVYFTFIAFPTLRELPEEILRPTGSQILLKCAVRKAKHHPVEIRWYKNGVLFTTHRGKLSISEIKQEDYGLYQCEASNEAGSDMRSVWLKEGNPSDNETMFSEDSSSKSVEEDQQAPPLIKKRPQPSTTKNFRLFDKSKEELFPFTSHDAQQVRFSKTPQDATVSSGTDKVTLECVAEGISKVSWFFNGIEIHAENSKYDVETEGLTIHDIRKSDEGEYSCEVGGVRESAMLQVNGDNLIEYGPTDQKSLIGTNVEFSCEVAKEYARRATIEWYLNDGLLPTNGNSGLRISRNRKGSLIIRQVGPDNTGEYRCLVKVDGREESASAMLQIIEKPAMPERVRAELHNETMPAKVRVLWNEGFDGNEPIIKHAVELRTLGPTGEWSEWSTIIDNIPKEEGKPCCWADIEDLRPSSTAEFRVVASNKHGAGKPSQASRSVTMPQQPPSAAPRNVAASARSSHSVIVEWKQPKDELTSENVLGYVVRYRLAGYSSLSWNEKNLTAKDAWSAVIDDLITWREYEVQVAAYNKRGLGVFSKSVEVTTLQGVPTQAPKNLKTKVLNSTAVQVEFSAPEQQRIPGVNLGYKVQFWHGEPGQGQLYKETILDPDRRQLSTTIGELEKFGHYNVTVLCFTSPGEGPRSAPVLTITEEDLPDAVDALSVDEVMYNGAVLTWNAPIRQNGIVTRYTIRHWAASQPDVKTRHEVDGVTTSFTIEGLEPSTRYVVDVMASTKKGDGPVEETKFESGVPPELPGRPSSLSIGEIAATSVQLHFTPGFDGHTAIRQWVVEARVADSSVFTHIFNVSAPKARSIVVAGLRPYTQYQLRLIAENVKGRGAPSEPSRQFETQQTNPETPSHRLFAEPVSATSIAVSWTPLLATQWNGQPKGYLIVYRETGLEDWKEIRTPALRASEHTIIDLRPFKTYEVNVFAENAFGRSLPTDAVRARTYESVPSGAPSSIKATADGSKSVLVKWEPVADVSTNGDVIGYKVRVVPERESLIADESREMDVPGQSTLMSKIGNLRPYTTYHVYVSAYTIVGNGPENSMAVTFETLEDAPGSPEAFQCSFVNENEVRLKWLPPSSPNGKISSYIISYWKSHEPRNMAIDAPLLGNLLLFSATSLNPSTQYTFAIKAINSKGESEETIAQVVTSSARVPVRNPPVPTRDHQRQHSPSEITIRWDDSARHPEDVESPIRLVQVSYQKANDDEWTTIDRKFAHAKHSATVKRLTPNSMYRFRIRFLGDFLESSWSAESEWIRTLPAAPLAQPIALKATPYETTSLQLEWTVPHKSTWNSDAIGYRIHYREYPSNGTWQMQEIAVSAEAKERDVRVLEHLQRFRHYIVRMRLFNGEGEGPFSPPVFGYVGYAVPKRNVTNLRSEPVSSSAINVRWDPWKMEGSASEEEVTSVSFKVRYVPVASVLSSVSAEEEMMIVDTNECTLNDLRKFTEYQIAVSPYNRAGEGKQMVIREKTLEDVPGPVGALQFSDVLLDSVRVSWDTPTQPNGVVTGYIVNYKGYRMQEEFKNEDQKRTTRTTFEANGLAEGVTYYFIVWAETSAGKGEPRSANVTIGPSRDGPSAPSKPAVVPGQSAVTLTWKDLPSSEIVGHLIQAKRVSAAEETDHGYVSVSQRPRRAISNRPTHPIGEWITLRPIDGIAEKEHVSYRELQPSSFYVFRVFARNSRGVGMASAESEQLFVPESIPDDPFYTTWWFLAIVIMAAFVLIVVFVAILCITGSTAKYRREKRSRSVDSLQLADGNFASFQLKGTNAGNMTRSRGELPTRPGTTQSWLSDQSTAREPPAYGSVLSDHSGVANSRVGGNGGASQMMNMYGLATDVIPPLPNAEAMQRLSALVGRDMRTTGNGSAYVTASRGSDYMPTRSSEYGNRSEYGRVEYNGRIPSSAATSTSQQLQQQQHLQTADLYDSFDEEEDVGGGEEDDHVDGGPTIRGDRRPSEGGGADDIARHYGSTDHYRDTWRKVRETDVVRAPIIPGLPGSAAGRSSTTESTSDSGWPSAQPNLVNGFSSFV